MTLVVGRTPTSSCRCAGGCSASCSRTSLGNSIRYAGQGTTCTVQLAEGLLSVSDDGVGVPSADLPRLFERFYRSDQARTSRGTGLGLAIVKHIVTSAGGEIEATSEPGQGLAIRIAFPRA